MFKIFSAYISIKSQTLRLAIVRKFSEKTDVLCASKVIALFYYQQFQDKFRCIKAHDGTYKI